MSDYQVSWIRASFASGRPQRCSFFLLSGLGGFSGSSETCSTKGPHSHSRTLPKCSLPPSLHTPHKILLLLKYSYKQQKEHDDGKDKFSIRPEIESSSPSLTHSHSPVSPSAPNHSSFCLCSPFWRAPSHSTLQSTGASTAWLRRPRLQVINRVSLGWQRGCVVVNLPVWQCHTSRTDTVCAPLKRHHVDCFVWANFSNSSQAIMALAKIGADMVTNMWKGRFYAQLHKYIHALAWHSL